MKGHPTCQDQAVRRAISLQAARQPCRAQAAARPKTTAALTVRPYTVRKGDTLESIAQKRGEAPWLRRMML